MYKGYSRDKFNESAFLSMGSIIRLVSYSLIYHILPPCVVVIFWLFNIISNCTVFPLFVSLNVGFVRPATVQYFPSWSGPNWSDLVPTTSAFLISIGDCLLPSHFLLTTPQFAGPKPKHFNVFTLNISEYGLSTSVNWNILRPLKPVFQTEIYWQEKIPH